MGQEPERCAAAGPLTSVSGLGDVGQGVEEAVVLAW